MRHYNNIQELADELHRQNDDPVPTFVFRPHELAAKVGIFSRDFRGDIYYPVKTNDHELVIKTLVDSDINRFDVASPYEMEHVRSISETAELAYTHPVPTVSKAKLAAEKYGIHRYTVDDDAALDNLIASRIIHKDTIICVRVLRTLRSASIPMDKFGASNLAAVRLLGRVDLLGAKAGISFHVGSQACDVDDFEYALEDAADILKTANVPISVLNVGGGFPARYGFDLDHPGTPTSSLANMLQRASSVVEQTDFGPDIQVIAEPGRSLVAEAFSVVARVELRRSGSRSNELIFNCGIWQGLSEAYTSGLTYPARLIGRESSAPLQAFDFGGVTCDGLDKYRNIWLPEDIASGDIVEIGHVGAYSLALMTNFNGFGGHDVVVSADDFAAPNIRKTLDQNEARQVAA